MSMKRKLIAMLATAAIVASVVSGCSKPGTGAATETPKSTETPATQSNINKTGLPIVKETVNYTALVKKNAGSKNTYAEKEAVIKAEKDTNVKIEWQEVPANGWNDKVNIVVSSGDLPDFLMGGVPAATFLNNVSLFLPINDLLETWAPNITKTLNENPEVKKAITNPDGKIYAIPHLEMVPFLVDDQLTINKTWLDKLGLKVPETTEEFYQVLKAFKEKDPNGNGKPDEIPFSMAMASNSFYHFYSMFGSFGVLENDNARYTSYNPGHTMVKDGKVILSAAEPGYYEALKYFNKLFSEGLIDSEAFSQNEQQLQAKGQAKEAILGSFTAYMDDLVVGAANQANYVYINPLKGPNGDQLWNMGNPTPGMFAINMLISKEVKDPEVLLRWVDYVNQDIETQMLWEYGAEGTSWRELDDGRWEPFNDNIPQGSNWGEYRHTISVGTEAPVVMDPKFTVDKKKLPARGEEKHNALKAMMPFIAKEYMPAALEDPKVAQDRNNLYAEIDTYLKNFIAKSVMTGITDKDWEEHLGKLKQLKVDEYLKIMQAKYDMFK